MKQLSWRPDIDGLRGVAVVLVVLYHVGVPGFSGGYVGVDVFFVISGFLITRQLLTMRGRPMLDVLRDFYARRARRILPALCIVLLATLALASVFLLPDGEQQDLGKSTVAAAAFASNVFFWRFSHSYFAGPMELQPLLHTWSLGVEEQFYMIWPFLIGGLWYVGKHVRDGKRDGSVLHGGVLCVITASLLLSIRWTHTAPLSGFYLTPPRMWEIGTGALVAIREERGKYGPSGPFFPLAGLCAILVAAVLYRPDTPFPGVAALLPVVGSALIVAAPNATASKNDFGRRVLSCAPLVFLGGVSYAWYLWHWPLLAVARTAALGARNLPRDVCLAVASLAIAYLSTRYIEQPIRHRRLRFLHRPRGVLAGAFGSIVLCLFAGAALYARARSTYRSTLAPLSMSCLSEGASLFQTLPGLNSVTGAGNPCILAEGQKSRVFLIGDSHANHWSPTVAEWANLSNVSAYERSFAGCPVLFEAFNVSFDREDVHTTKECKEFSRNFLAELEATSRQAKVGAVISIYWNYLADSSDSRSFANGLDLALDSLDRIGIPAILIGPTPVLDVPGPKCLARMDKSLCRVARSQFEAERALTFPALRAVAQRHPDVRVYDPASTFCDEQWCYAERDGQLMFRDKDHLSRAGAEAANVSLAPYLDWLMTRMQNSSIKVASSFEPARSTSLRP